MRTILVCAVCLTVGAIAAGCGSSAGIGTSGGGTDVVAAFYPLAYAAAEIGGKGADVTNLTPAGAEPHDIELTPREVVAIQQADLVLYLSHGFQPAVQDAARDATGTALDALAAIPLRQGVGDEAGRTDPHVWLDPVLYARIAARIGRALHRPAAADAFARRAHALDREYRDGLAHCARRTFVTSHASFGYLAARYHLRQLAITGVDPQAEPTARKLIELSRLVRREHVGTVFFERLVSPRLAQTVAREAGAKTAVLDPIEGLTGSEADSGATYFSLMRQNLRELRTALGCR